MKQEVQAAFAEMLDISTDIDKAVLIGPDGVLASNMATQAQAATVAQAGICRLAETRTAEMGSQPFTQLVVETPSGYVFFARETGGRHDHAGDRQEGQPGRSRLVRPQDLHEGRPGGHERRDPADEDTRRSR